MVMRIHSQLLLKAKPFRHEGDKKFWKDKFIEAALGGSTFNSFSLFACACPTFVCGAPNLQTQKLMGHWVEQAWRR